MKTLEMGQCRMHGVRTNSSQNLEGLNKDRNTDGYGWSTGEGSCKCVLIVLL